MIEAQIPTNEDLGKREQALDETFRRTSADDLSRHLACLSRTRIISDLFGSYFSGIGNHLTIGDVQPMYREAWTWVYILDEREEHGEPDLSNGIIVRVP
jgi:hypothetical protein